MLVDVTVALSLIQRTGNYLQFVISSPISKFHFVTTSTKVTCLFVFKLQLLVVPAKNSHVGRVKYLIKKITYP